MGPSSISETTRSLNFAHNHLSGLQRMIKDVSIKRRTPQQVHDDRNAKAVHYNQITQNTIFKCQTLKHMAYSSKGPHRVSAQTMKLRQPSAQTCQTLTVIGWKHCLVCDV